MDEELMRKLGISLKRNILHDTTILRNEEDLI